MGGTCDPCSAKRQTMPLKNTSREASHDAQRDALPVPLLSHSSGDTPCVEINTWQAALATRDQFTQQYGTLSDSSDSDWAPQSKLDLIVNSSVNIASAVDGILCGAAKPAWGAVDSSRLRDEAGDILGIEARAQGDQLVKMNTMQLDKLTDDLFDDIGGALLQTEKVDLPHLSAWMFYFENGGRRQSTMMAREWLKRFVVLSEGYIMWNERERSVPDRMDDAQKKLWARCVPVMAIQQVVAVHGDVECRKIKMTFKDGGRSLQCVWRTNNKEERNTWIRALRKHIKVHRKEARFNATHS